MKKIDVYVHADKETTYDAGMQAGLTPEACEVFMFSGYEEKLTFCVDDEGHSVLVAVNDLPLIGIVEKGEDNEVYTLSTFGVISSFDGDSSGPNNKGFAVCDSQ